MNILILAAGLSSVDTLDNSYPFCLTELDGIPLIERLIEGCQSIGEDIRFIVALREVDIQRYHLDNVVSLLAPDAKILRIRDMTKGAACTALLAAEYIDSDDELLILNGNELLDVDFPTVLGSFRQKKLDAGVVTFPSVHPRYSYVRLSSEGLVVEAAEKNPISRMATVGFYWFFHGQDFVRAAQNMIRKDASIGGLYYICPSLNEVILEQGKIGTYQINLSQFHPLKTERQLNQFEIAIEQQRK